MIPICCFLGLVRTSYSGAIQLKSPMKTAKDILTQLIIWKQFDRREQRAFFFFLTVFNCIIPVSSGANCPLFIRIGW